MKALLIDVNEGHYKEVDVRNDWKELAKACNCNYVEHIHMMIGHKPFTIICDEDATLKEAQKVSAVTSEGEIALVGNLIITDLSLGDEFEDLSDHNCEYLLNHITFVTSKKDSSMWPILLDVGPLKK
jgi:hypothetical protein